MNTAFTTKETRHFYLIGHRCNTIERINKAFEQQVNGMECDLWVDDKKKWWISHEGIFKTDLIEWLSYIEKAEKKYNREMSLIIFDIKTPGPFAGTREIINKLLPHNLPRIYSTSSISKAYIFKDVVSLLTSIEGIAIDEEDDPKQVGAFFESIGASQCWYGNGITLIPLNEQFHISMKKAAPIRDSTGPFSKIYTWSVHRKAALRKYIEEDKVDGVIVALNNIFTNPVTNALSIIEANNEVELATRNSPLFTFQLTT